MNYLMEELYFNFFQIKCIDVQILINGIAIQELKFVVLALTFYLSVTGQLIANS